VAGIKRRDLAEMSGLTIETCVRLLKDFQQRRLIKKKGKDLALLDLEQLRAVGSGGL
jgi:CRP-like cAMP-binding protein